MTQVYFRCSNPKEVLVDRCGAVVVPQPPIVAARAGFFELFDEHKRIGDSAGGDGEKRMARFSRVPAPVGTGEYRAVGAGRVLTPNAQAKDLSKAAGKSGLTAAGITNEE